LAAFALLAFLFPGKHIPPLNGFVRYDLRCRHRRGQGCASPVDPLVNSAFFVHPDPRKCIMESDTFIFETFYKTDETDSAFFPPSVYSTRAFHSGLPQWATAFLSICGSVESCRRVVPTSRRCILYDVQRNVRPR